MARSNLAVTFWAPFHDSTSDAIHQALIFSLIVGSYWLLRTQKDVLFMKITGKLYIPYAKMGTFMVNPI